MLEPLGVSCWNQVNGSCWSYAGSIACNTLSRGSVLSWPDAKSIFRSSAVVKDNLMAPLCCREAGRDVACTSSSMAFLFSLMHCWSVSSSLRFCAALVPQSLRPSVLQLALQNHYCCCSDRTSPLVFLSLLGKHFSKPSQNLEGMPQ